MSATSPRKKVVVSGAGRIKVITIGIQGPAGGGGVGGATPPATASQYGGIKLPAGHLAGTPDAPTVPLLEAKANKDEVASSLAAQTAATAAKYTKPGTGIPEADLAPAVKTKLNSGGVTSVNGSTGAITGLATDAALQNEVTARQTADATAAQALADGLATKGSKSALDAHVADSANPHQVTKAQVGLSNADNTSDKNKPLSDATQTALNAKPDISYVNGQIATRYQKPSDGIPEADLSQAVRDKLGGSQGATNGQALTKTITQSGHGFSVGQAVRYDGSQYVKALADNDDHGDVDGVVIGVAGPAFTLHIGGLYEGYPSGMTLGYLFLSAATAGALTTSEPTGVGQVSKPVLHVVGTGAAYFLPYRGAVLGAPAPLPAAVTVGTVGMAADFVCDGVDDQVTFREAALAAGGRGIKAFAGTYWFSAPLNLPDGTRLSGCGMDRTHIYFDATHAPQFSYSYLVQGRPVSGGAVGKNCTIEDIDFDGQTGNITAPIDVNGVGLLEVQDGWLVQRCSFGNTVYFRNWVNGVRNVTIRDNYYYGDNANKGSQDAIGGGTCDNVLVMNNTFSADLGALSLIDHVNSDRVKFVYNRSMSTKAVYVEGGDGWFIHGNDFDGGSHILLMSDAGYSPTDANGFKVTANNARNCTVSRNRIKNVTGLRAISVAYEWGSTNFTMGGNNTVVGNSINDCAQIGILVTGSTKVTPKTYMRAGDLIAHNVIVNANSDSTRSNPNQSFSGTGTADTAGINIMQGYGIKVSDNVIVDSRDTPLMRYGIQIGQSYQPSATTEPNRVQVVDNFIDGFAVADVNVNQPSWTTDIILRTKTQANFAGSVNAVGDIVSTTGKVRASSNVEFGGGFHRLFSSEGGGAGNLSGNKGLYLWADNSNETGNAGADSNGQKILHARGTDNTDVFAVLDAIAGVARDFNVFTKQSNSSLADVARLTVKGATGNVGIGTQSPGERLEIFSADATMRLRNVGDPGGAFVGDSYGTLQLGLYNPGAAAWNNIAAGVKQTLFGVDSTGRVGSITNAFASGSPAWRNLLDDGSGNLKVSGTNNGSYINGMLRIGSTDAPTALLQLSASSTSRASMRLDSGSAPSNPNNGDVWFNSVDSIFYQRLLSNTSPFGATLPYTVTTGALTLGSTHGVIEVSGAHPITLPSVANYRGRSYKLINVSAASITITANGTDTIGDSSPAGTTYSLPAGASVVLTANGSTGWRVSSQFSTAYVIKRVEVNDADYAATVNDQMIAYQTLTAARSVQLVALSGNSTTTQAQVQEIHDESGSAGSFAITVLPPSGKTINGQTSMVINTNYGQVRVYQGKNGNFFTR